MDAIIWKLLYYAVSSVPLYFALRLLGARNAGFIKVVLVNFLVSVIVSAIFSSFGWTAAVIAFIAVLFVYKVMFELGWLSAFLAWLLTIVIAAVLLGAIVLLFGIAILAVLIA